MYQILTDVLHQFACNVENLRLDLFLTLMINGQLKPAIGWIREYLDLVFTLFNLRNSNIRSI